MKTVLRVATLVLCALTGLVVTGYGIAHAVLIHTPGHADIMRHLIEGSISIAGGACVVAVAIDQLECLRTHRKSRDLL
jgi:translation elongation factor EF-Tu-like GTPase